MASLWIGSVETSWNVVVRLVTGLGSVRFVGGLVVDGGVGIDVLEPELPEADEISVRARFNPAAKSGVSSFLLDLPGLPSTLIPAI